MNASPPKPNVDAGTPYAAMALAEAPRLLSLLDREPHSPTYGSFDREHWAWKFRDFPQGMLQSAVYPLALLWRYPFQGSPYHHNQRLLQWIGGAIEQTMARQHANGAFDAFAPNEQDPGPTLGMLHGLLAAWRLMGEELPTETAGRLRSAVREACEFSMRREDTEVHAFVSNHWGLFAVAMLDAAELLGEERYRRRAEGMVARILREQSPDGWYNEYGGADPGYESLGIFHLAVYWQRTGSREVLDSLRRSLEFYAYCAHPDGSVGGCYGSRHTSLYFPGGFEILAPHLPAAASIARYMREQLHRNNVVTPAISDAENLPALCYSYLEAARVTDSQAAVNRGSALPHQVLQGVRRFEHSGLCFAGGSSYYAAVQGKRGGVCRIFDKPSGRVTYEDAGYLIRARGRWWTSQLQGLGSLLPAPSEAEIQCAAQFAEVRSLVPTPLRFLLLRVLNLTLFRSVALGEWLRKQIIRRLILARRPGPFRMRRRVEFCAKEVRITDQLQMGVPVTADEIALPRSFLAIHMGSAKYFHAAELESTQQVPVAGLLRELNAKRVAENCFTIEFRSEQAPEKAARVATGDTISR